MSQFANTNNTVLLAICTLPAFPTMFLMSDCHRLCAVTNAFPVIPEVCSDDIRPFIGPTRRQQAD